ncbi:AraC family transcriptional regulator, partial [Coprobacillus cateniformis]|nr:AraC family transcriptional regulator [Coprobacillus cateniformis]
YIVPAMTWAVFPCTIETIGKTEVQAITKWLPKSRYKPLNSGYITGRMKSGAPDIQYYGQDGIVEIWIGVTEK